MRRRNRLLVALGLAVGLLSLLLVWQVTREGDWPFFSPVPSPTTGPASPSLPLTSLLEATPLAPAGVGDSPLSLPPTGTPPVNVATLAALRTSHPTPTLPSPAGIRWPSVSPDTWRRWALWIFAAAGLLAYIGLRLRQGE